MNVEQTLIKETKGTIQIVVAENAITATNTPVSISCAGAKKIGIIFTEGGSVNARSGALTLTVSLDNGKTYVSYNMLIDNVANTNAQNFTRIASKTRAAAGNDILWLDPSTLGVITHIKNLVTITDGGSPTGNFTVKNVIEY